MPSKHRDFTRHMSSGNAYSITVFSFVLWHIAAIWMACYPPETCAHYRAESARLPTGLFSGWLRQPALSSGISLSDFSRCRQRSRRSSMRKRPASG
ncbi:hypothetical protein KCP78_10495 [Salmonella enterica subsp. enterica]|nr:hypothetical protein KCP78_10495 [Salmonella enterica subsp. enterica]